MKPPSLILWQRKIGESRNSNPGAFAIKTIRARPMKTPALQAIEQYVHNVQKGQKDLLAMAGAHNGLAPGDGMSRGLHHH